VVLHAQGDDAVGGQDRTLGWRGLHDAPADIQHRDQRIRGSSGGAKRHRERRGWFVWHDMGFDSLACRWDLNDHGTGLAGDAVGRLEVHLADDASQPPQGHDARDGDQREQVRILDEILAVVIADQFAQQRPHARSLGTASVEVEDAGGGF